jgi:hypothetical protein
MTNFGDKIASVATPIARALGMDCIDPITNQLRPESGCNKMRQNLNAGMSLSDAIFERWFKAKQQGITMQYQMQIVVEADNLKEAVQKVQGGEIISAQVKPTPPTPQRPQPLPPPTPKP